MTKNEVRFAKIELLIDLNLELTETTEILMAYYLILRGNSEFDYQKEAIEAKAEEKIAFIDEMKKHIVELREVKTEKQLNNFKEKLKILQEKYPTSQM